MMGLILYTDPADMDAMATMGMERLVGMTGMMGDPLTPSCAAMGECNTIRQRIHWYMYPEKSIAKHSGYQLCRVLFFIEIVLHVGFIGNLEKFIATRSSRIPVV